MIVTQVLLLVGMAFSATTVTANPATRTCQHVKCPVRCEIINGNPTCVNGGPPTAVAAVDGNNTLSNDAINTSVATGGKCGITTCPTGKTCCNASCGLCVSPGEACTQQICEPAGVQCGPSVCSGDTPVCCNKSCGICTAPGGFCTQQFCERGFTPSESKRNEVADTIKLGNQKCGNATCPEGTICCNSSCGICVKPGGACTQQICPSADIQAVEEA